MNNPASFRVPETIMAPPPLLQDFVSLMLLLAPSAALICLVLAGLNFRRDVGGAAIIGGGFSRWIFWAVVFITIPGLISWFPSFGVAPSLPGNPSIQHRGWPRSKRISATSLQISWSGN